MSWVNEILPTQGRLPLIERLTWISWVPGRAEAVLQIALHRQARDEIHRRDDGADKLGQPPAADIAGGVEQARHADNGDIVHRVADDLMPRGQNPRAASEGMLPVHFTLIQGLGLQVLVAAIDLVDFGFNGG